MVRRNAGFTMIEILIAVLVLGIGLLGVAGLQSVALGMNHGSYVRSQATVLARDIADRMRVNQRAVADGEYDMGGGATVGQETACESTSGCTTAQMASHDLWEWDRLLGSTLPNGDGVVCIDSTPADGSSGAPACDGSGDNYAIKIWWYNKEDDVPEQFVTVFRP